MFSGLIVCFRANGFLPGSLADGFPDFLAINAIIVKETRFYEPTAATFALLSQTESCFIIFQFDAGLRASLVALVA